MRSNSSANEAANHVKMRCNRNLTGNHAWKIRFTNRLGVSIFLISSYGVSLSGCATIVRGGSEKLVIQSVPSGAEVKLSTGQSAVTPAEVEVKRKDTIFVTISKGGYKKFETASISSIDGASLGIGTVFNFLFLPIVNDIVDYQVGANYSHKPNPIIANLTPNEYGATESPHNTDSATRYSGPNQSRTPAAISARGDVTEQKSRAAQPQSQQPFDSGSRSALSSSRQPAPERLAAPERKAYGWPKDKEPGSDSF
jgi:hypothetical protein